MFIVIYCQLRFNVGSIHETGYKQIMREGEEGWLKGCILYIIYIDVGVYG